MTESCVSELLIDQLLAGELAPPIVEQTRGHAAGCPRCGELLTHAETIASRFAADPPRLRLPDRRRTVALGLGAAVAAAAVVIAIGTRRDDEGIRTKGGATLGCFVAHGGDSRSVQSGEVVARGDRLQLVATTERAGWIAVTGVDAHDVRTVYAAPQPLAAGRERALPFSIILDDTLGSTTIAAVFCPGPFAIEAPPGECTTDSLTLETRR